MTDDPAILRAAEHDLGSCWCCAQHGIVTPAVSTVGLCRPCGSRSPSACQEAHRKQAST
jgi:hypothetical protein